MVLVGKDGHPVANLLSEEPAVVTREEPRKVSGKDSSEIVAFATTIGIVVKGTTAMALSSINTGQDLSIANPSDVTGAPLTSDTPMFAERLRSSATEMALHRCSLRTTAC